MKKILSLLAVVFTLGLSSMAMDAEAAKRMGSGKSMGTQRQATADKAPAAPAQSSAAAPAAGAAAAAPSRSWMGPIAGIAAGLGLAALASHLGFGDELASMLMMGLLAAAVMVVVGLVMRKRAAARTGGMQYAHAGAGRSGGAGHADQAAPAYKLAMPAGGSSMGSATGSVIGSNIGNTGSGAVSASPIPADFDTASFERNAKVNFIRLQAANDAGNLDDIRQFTTPQMFAELKMELTERAGRGVSVQKTDVISLHAEVMEVVEDADGYGVSVRFTGVMRDDSGEPDESFDEVWHLSKPRQAQQGWVLSGIQQTV